MQFLFVDLLGNLLVDCQATAHTHIYNYLATNSKRPQMYG